MQLGFFPIFWHEWSISIPAKSFVHLVWEMQHWELVRNGARSWSNDSSVAWRWTKVSVFACHLDLVWTWGSRENRGSWNVQKESKREVQKKHLISLNLAMHEKASPCYALFLLSIASMELQSKWQQRGSLWYIFCNLFAPCAACRAALVPLWSRLDWITVPLKMFAARLPDKGVRALCRQAEDAQRRPFFQFVYSVKMSNNFPVPFIDRVICIVSFLDFFRFTDRELCDVHLHSL